MFQVQHNKATPTEARYVELEREAELEKCYMLRHRKRIFGALPPELKKYENKPYAIDYRIDSQ
ncbi:hypothetical protein [Zhenhengia yiwuensis]|uniref:Uncharacterized protein n=1 Tax=Zhenhengia yiwuensis TaxID=2763666 RepID=A0A926EJP4_9FIRM|nr:hypothetical protein [Zhenhengia yiwuensis]MBC8580936.1 hypothetical protein [Zhenhengia yiwuensis]